MLILVAAALLSACSRSTIRARPPGEGTASEHAIENPGPFAPVSIRIHPLTHIAELPNGQAEIVCHIEFKDRWHQPVKAAGPLEIQLYQPVGGLNAELDRQNLRWPLELGDLDRNADWYDAVTRTYRFQLEVPAGALPGSGSLVRLRAVFVARTAEGAEITLRDDYVIQR